MKILKSILEELVLIRKELQAIRDIMESSSKINIDGTEIAKSVQKAILEFDSFVPEDSKGKHKKNGISQKFVG